jgi:hypothetical protein
MLAVVDVVAAVAVDFQSQVQRLRLESETPKKMQ